MDENDVIKLNVSDNSSRKYNINAIYNSAINAKESADHLLGLYYLVFRKFYLKKRILRSLFWLFSNLKS